MTFGEVLAQFKEDAEPENIMPLTEDDSLRSGIVAWKSVVIENKSAGAECEEQEPSRQWNWLWEQVQFDVSSFGIVAGCRAQDAGNLFNRLKGLRLIYPDGTIHQYASQYLQSIIMTKLKKAK